MRRPTRDRRRAYDAAGDAGLCLRLPQTREPHLALQSVARVFLTNISSYARMTACRLDLEVLEVANGERGEGRRCATRDLAHEVPLERVGLVREYFEEGE